MHRWLAIFAFAVAVGFASQSGARRTTPMTKTQGVTTQKRPAAAKTKGWGYWRAEIACGLRLLGNLTQPQARQRFWVGRTLLGKQFIVDGKTGHRLTQPFSRVEVSRDGKAAIVTERHVRNRQETKQWLVDASGERLSRSFFGTRDAPGLRFVDNVPVARVEKTVRVERGVEREHGEGGRPSTRHLRPLDIKGVFDQPLNVRTGEVMSRALFVRITPGNNGTAIGEQLLQRQVRRPGDLLMFRPLRELRLRQTDIYPSGPSVPRRSSWIVPYSHPTLAGLSMAPAADSN